MRCLGKTLTVSSCLFLSFMLVSSANAANGARAASPASVSSGANGAAANPVSPAKADAAERYGNLPLSFEANQGQTDNQVRFLSRGNGYSFFLTPAEAVLTLARDSRSEAAVLRMQLAGANPDTHIQGLDPLPGKSNYFFGSDASRWRTGVPTYSKVAYADVYPGINLVYYGNQQQLEYDFVIAPGADPRQIRLTIAGAQKLTVDAQGNLVLRSAGGDVQLLAPKVYQQINESRHEIAGRWVLAANHSAGFRLGAYDHTQPLVIDPVLMYSSFLGGSQQNTINRIAIDAAGNAYVAGYTASGDFPAAPTPQLMSFGGGTAGRGAFVAKIDSTGSTLIYSTYLSGSANGEEATGLAVDNSGNVYLAGNTHSTDFPTYNAFQSSCPTHNQARSCSSAFLTKISSTGDSLVFSTYLGGSGGESARGLAVDSLGSAYVAGITSSLDFPVTAGAAQSKCGGSCQQNAFVAKFAASGGNLVYASNLGGSGVDDVADIAVDASSSAYVTGRTTSADFPLSAPFQKSCAHDATSSSGACVATAFVTKLKADGSAFAYSTYLGGSLGSQASAIAVDSRGSAYVTGSTQSADFPVVSPFQKSCGIDKKSGLCSVDAFLTKLDSSGKTLVYSTYLGGSGSDSASGIVVDAKGNVSVVGSTQSADFPTIAPVQSKLKGTSDAFIARFNAAGSSLTFSTYHGGSAAESGSSVALDTTGNIYIAGATSSTDFPTQHPFQSSCAGTCASAFVSKMSVPPPAGAAWTITSTHTDPFLEGQAGATYTIAVQNSGSASTSGTITVVDNLPSGLTATAMAVQTGGTTNWTCTFSTATCTTSDVLAAGASYSHITLTVNVADTANTPLINTATVSGGGAATVTSPNDTTNVVFPLSINVNDSGNFIQGRTGVTYTISGTNNGKAATGGSGKVTVTDTLPVGITATAMAATGWSCTVATTTCTNTAAISAGGTYSITLTVNVANNAASSVTNSVTISETGFTLSATNSDTTTVLPAPVLSISKTHTGTFALGGTGTWTIAVKNSGPATSTTYGPLTVTDVLPSGAGYTYTLASSSGTNWSCVTAGTTTITVTCTDSTDVEASGSSFPTLSLVVNIPAGSPSTISNTAATSAGDAGAINAASGSDNNVPVGFSLSIRKTDSGNFIQGRTGVTYTISGTNNGNTATGGSGTVTVTDTLPTGITATAMSGTGWSCTVATTTCTNTAAIAAGGTYSITLTVSVANTATSPLTNNVTISETGFTQSATATDNTTILPAPVLSVAKSHTGTFTQSFTGTWTITVMNSGPATSVTYGPLTVTDTLPSGTNNGIAYAYTLASSSGTNWSCTGQGTGTVSCADSVDTETSGNSFPTLTLTVNVPNTSPTSVTNTATASGAGALSSAVGSDTPTIVQVPATVNVISGTPQSAVVANAFAAPLVAQVLDAANVGINGITVSFNSPAAGPSATPNPATATTGGAGSSAGTAASPTLTANGQNGSYQVTAQATVSTVTKTSSPYTLTNTDFTMVQVPATSTIYIQGQNQPFGSNPAAMVTVSSLPTPSGAQPSYTGTVNLSCADAALTNGFTCLLSPTPDTFSNGLANGSSNATSSASLTVPNNTPVGIYTVTATGADLSAVTDTHSTSFGLSVQCILSLQQVAPVFVPASSSSDGNNQYQVSVSVVQGGNACPYGNSPAAGGFTPGTVAGDGTVVAATPVTGTSGTSTSTQATPVTFEIAATPGSAPANGAVTVPYFSAALSGGILTAGQTSLVLPVTVETPVTVNLQTSGTGAVQGSVPLVVSQAGTLNVPTLANSSSICGVVPNNANVTCFATAPSQQNPNWQITVTITGLGSSARKSNAGAGAMLALGIPAIVFLGVGVSAFGPRRRRRGAKKITSLLGILLIVFLLVVVPSCGGGFQARFITGTTPAAYTLTVMGYIGTGTNVQGVEVFTISVPKT